MDAAGSTQQISQERPTKHPGTPLENEPFSPDPEIRESSSSL
jgi:hypothetical protein